MRLIACGTCDRHILDKEAVCPFCGAVPLVPGDEVQHHGGRGVHALATMCAGMLFACAPTDSGMPQEAGSTGSSEAEDGTDSVSATGLGMTTVASTSSPPDPGGSSGDPPSVTTGEDATDDASDWDDTGDSPAGFYAGPSPDGQVSVECDLFAQDCPEGEKCMPWANDGGSAWNATRCTPLAAPPVQVGDECTVEGSGVSGIDDCDTGVMCWDVDSETNTGTCVSMCIGDEANPICEDPDTTCAIMNDGVLVLCVPTCDPLLQDCEEGQACYPVLDEFVCLPDGSGEMGAAGDQCEYIDACDPGTVCLGAAAITTCQGAGCCVPVCDHTDAESDALCAEFDAGTLCEPWFEDGRAPPDYQHIGACVAPP